MMSLKCLCHFPDGTEAIREVVGDPLTRGNQVGLDGDAAPWYVTRHTPTTGAVEETIAKPFDGNAVVLWTDGSVKSLPIDRATGQAMLGSQSLLDPTNPVWSGKPPVLLLPE